MSTYHPLQSYPDKITIRDIHREKGHCGLTADPVSPDIYGLKELALGDQTGGDGEALNRNNPASMIARIEKTGVYSDLEQYPYALSDWYQYDHTKTGGSTESDTTIPSGDFTVYPLVNSLILSGYSRFDPKTVKDLKSYYSNVRRNDSTDTTEPTPTSGGYAQVGLEQEIIGTLTAKITAYAKRVFFKIDVTSINSTTEISAAIIKFTASLGTTSDKYALVYYPETTVNIANWFNPTYRISNIKAYSATTMEFELNSFGIGLLQQHIAAQTDFIVGIMVMDDLQNTVPLSGNLIPTASSDGTSTAGWSIISPASYEYILANYDSGDPGRDKVFRAYVDNLDSPYNYGAYLLYDHDNISSWVDDDPSYTNNGYTTDYYLINFWYKWVVLPEEESMLLGRSVISLNGNNKFSVLGSFIEGWSKAWTECDLNLSSGNITEDTDGLEIYLQHHDSSVEPELLLDDIVLMPAYFAIDKGAYFEPYSAVVTIATDNTAPSIDTKIATSIEYDQATSGGENISDNGSAITEKGLVWRKGTMDPTLSNNDGSVNKGTGTGTFTYTMTGLDYNSAYKVRAYATNAIGTTYGNSESFTTDNVTSPSVSTSTGVRGADGTSFKAGGYDITDGGGSITEKGVCYKLASSAGDPDLTDSYINFGTGTLSFSTSVTGLTPGTTYKVRAYVKNQAGTAYGTTLYVTNYDYCEVWLHEIYQLTDTSLSVRIKTGNINDNDGEAQVVGVLVSDNDSTPDLSSYDYKSEYTGGVGADDLVALSIASVLSTSTLYYCRVYATNDVGTTYDSVFQVTTGDIPTLDTVAVTMIGTTSATSGGENLNDQGNAITGKGIVWKENGIPYYPSDYDGISAVGSGGETPFSKQMTGLTEATTYNVRAYAENTNGVGHGDAIEFTTNQSTSTTPSVSTNSETLVSINEATLNGNVTSDGGAPIIKRGFQLELYATAFGTSSDIVESYGDNTGSYSKDVYDLTKNTRYKFRAWAENSNGRSYGSVVDFYTKDVVWT